MAMNGYGMFPNEGQRALQEAYREGGIEEGQLVPKVTELAELAPMPNGEHGTDWRRKYAKWVDSILCNDFAYLVDDSLRRRYHQETYAEMELQAGVSTRHNPMVDSVDTLNRGVWPAASWRLMRDGAAVDDPRFTALVATGLNEAVRMASRLCWVHPAVCVMPWVADVERTKERKLVYRVITPSQFSVEPSRDAPGEWDELCIYHPVVDGIERKVEWSADEVEVYERRVREDGTPASKWREVREMPNPFGIIPAVLFRRQRDRIWADNYGEKLREATIEINAAQTLLTYHGPTQIKLLAAEFERGKFQRVRQAMPIASGPNNPVSVVDLQLDTGKFRDAYIDAELAAVAVSMGLPPDEFLKTRIAPASGESIRLRYAERQHRQEEHREAMLPAAVELYWTALHVLHVALGEGPVSGFKSVADLPPYEPETPVSEQPYTVAIDVQDQRLPSTQAERAAEQEYNVSKGFSTWSQELAKEQPDLKDPAGTITANLQDTAGLLRTAGRSAATRVTSPLPPRV